MIGHTDKRTWIRARASLTAALRDDRLQVRVDQKGMTDIWCRGSPVSVVAGESRTFRLVYVGQSSLSTPVATVYKGTADVTSTVMPSGTASATANVVTLKPMSALVGGETYVVTVQTTISGATDIRKFEVTAQKTTALQPITYSNVWCLESPVYMVAGESRAFNITYLGQTLVLGSGTVSLPGVAVYKGTTDVTTTVMPSGSASRTGNVVTTPAATGLIGGETYVVTVSCTIGPNTDIRKFQIVAVKASDVQ